MTIQVLQRCAALLVLYQACVIGLNEMDFNSPCDICACSTDFAIDCPYKRLTELPEGLDESVKLLNLSHNEFSSFPNVMNLKNLEVLDLSHNLLKSLPEDGLYNLEALSQLYLSHNLFEEWFSLSPNNFLFPAKSLKLLDISYNNFQTLGNLPIQQMLNSISLETLNLEHCKITSIHGRSPLTFLTNLRTLNLHNNPLRRITRLQSTSLKNLDISYCNLTYIHHDELTYLPSLNFLNMSHNQGLIISTDIGTLNSESLRHLDISNCYLNIIGLSGFPNLISAHLDDNRIGLLNPNEFKNNSKLETLSLSSNSIRSLKSNSFKGLNSLKQLDLSFNMISHIPEDIFLKTPSLLYLSLSRNEINHLGYIQSQSIRIIDMSMCEIETVGRDSLEGTSALLELNLSRNLIRSLPDSFSSSTLKYLDLSNNRLSTINNFTFMMLPKLSTLFLSGNRLSTIMTKHYFDSNPYLERLALSDNIWRCECDQDMYEFFEFLNLEPTKKEEAINLVCHSPPNIYGQTWHDACYFIWFPVERRTSADSYVYFVLILMMGVMCCSCISFIIRRHMKARLAIIQAEQERQAEEARERLRLIRMRHEQEAQRNAPDPRDLISPPSYAEALLLPRLDSSFHSLSEVGTGKGKRRKNKKRRSKSSGDLLEETDRNNVMNLNDLHIDNDLNDNRNQSRRRNRRYGSHEIRELDHSPSARRRRISDEDTDGNEIEVEVESHIEDTERPLTLRRQLSETDDITQSNF